MLRRIPLGCLVAVASLTLSVPGQQPTQPALPLSPPKPAGGQDGPADRPRPARTKVYDESADAKQQIAAALAKAKHENQRVLIQWGGNWCPWCIRLHETMTSNRDLVRELLDEYQLIHVDAGSGGDKNVELASSYGADLKSFGYPFLTVLDADGKPIANQETSSLERKGPDGKSIEGSAAGHDATKVLAFLKSHELPHPVAADVLKAGSERATSSERKLLVRFDISWGLWCRRLEEWRSSEEVAPLLAKDYVDVRIDHDRMEGAKAVEASLGMPENAFLPWLAIVEPATGKVLATSQSETGNVGFPMKDGEIAHVMKMFESTRSRITEADLQVLRESLIQSAKRIETAGQ